MVYLITFFEGILSFLSPCMLPMLPVYLSYFAVGDGKSSPGAGRILSFILGFTLSFLLLGLGFGALGGVLAGHRRAVELVSGTVMVFFGLSFLDVAPLPFFRGGAARVVVTGPWSAFLFGIVYSVSLTPCVGAFLGSALMLAANAGSMGKGGALLLVYALGMGLPFFLSGLLVSHLDGLFAGIKRHYPLLNRICGGFLIAVGIITALGWMNRLMGLFL